jgi:hypothetical protein
MSITGGGFGIFFYIGHYNLICSHEYPFHLFGTKMGRQ